MSDKTYPQECAHGRPLNQDCDRCDGTRRVCTHGVFLDRACGACAAGTMERPEDVNRYIVQTATGAADIPAGVPGHCGSEDCVPPVDCECLCDPCWDAGIAEAAGAVDTAGTGAGAPITPPPGTGVPDLRPEVKPLDHCKAGGGNGCGIGTCTCTCEGCTKAPLKCPRGIHFTPIGCIQSYIGNCDADPVCFHGLDTRNVRCTVCDQARRDAAAIRPASGYKMCTHAGAAPVWKIAGTEIYACGSGKWPEVGVDLVLDCTDSVVDRLIVPRDMTHLADFFSTPDDTIFVPWRDRAAPPLRFGFWPAFVRAFPKPEDCADGVPRIVVRCLGAHGRTGTALACILIVANPGMTGPEAVARVRTEHCAEAVETKAQEDYVAAFAKWWAGQPAPPATPDKGKATKRVQTRKGRKASGQAAPQK